MKNKAITLQERPAKGSNPSDYDVLLHGRRVGELYFNTRGYRGTLPTPDGAPLDLGEKPLGAWKREVASLNREFALAGGA